MNKIELKELLEKTYAGFLGMNIGIRLGAPVEPSIWTSDRIKEVYGNITEYVKDYKNFAADDDVNGPVFFLRALDDGALLKGELTSQDVAQTWLNYSREGIGMFWWGGYGISTEHTAYLNLKNGINPPESGSIKTNGLIRAEQIGGQIFIDTWGFVWPGNPEKAAEYATRAASVSHDGNGLYGASFIAACIAEAYENDNIDKIIDKGLEFIPSSSLYFKVVNAVRDFHKNHENWRDCLAYLQKEWGYDKYKGFCHIIPNAGVCIMAMIYGKTFEKAIEIATMAGWDTDCNAGNVGSILGVAQGLSSIPDKYRKPVNDGIVLSGISGYLNILDIPTYIKKLVGFSYSLNNEKIPEICKITEGEIHFDFELLGSTHGFRTSNNNSCRLKQSILKSHTGNGSLQVRFDRMKRGDSSRIFYKPMYRREDFDDERYSPAFSPLIYSGQQVKLYVYSDKFENAGSPFIISTYVRDSFDKKIIIVNSLTLQDNQWTEVSFKIPEMNGSYCDECGIILESNSRPKAYDYGCLYIDDFSVTGKADYSISLSKQKKEFQTITPFSINHGGWEIENDYLTCMCLEHGEAVTGNYFSKDVKIQAPVRVDNGSCALLGLRIQGAQRGYYGGIYKDQLVIGKNNNSKFEVLIKEEISYEKTKAYNLEFEAKGKKLSLKMGNRELVVEDDNFNYGMVGFASYQGGRSAYGTLKVKEL
ncbi:MAG: ADP-ribosylglycohydrolase family protein [Sphaerochaetaceae bacterium]